VVFPSKNVDESEWRHIPEMHFLLGAETLVKLTTTIRVTNLALISSHRFALADIFFAEKEEKEEKTILR
jgi:hypothetical protein